MNFEEALVLELSSIPSFENSISPFCKRRNRATFYCLYLFRGRTNTRFKRLCQYQRVNMRNRIIAKSYIEMKENTKLVIHKLLSFLVGPLVSMGLSLKLFLMSSQTNCMKKNMSIIGVLLIFVYGCKRKGGNECKLEGNQALYSRFIVITNYH